ncbi:MAG: hypothetical protein P4L16_03950, partial [Chlamydiales bacterium]|nr:hypothetical protein [Chlamydiales bacterium]
MTFILGVLPMLVNQFMSLRLEFLSLIKTKLLPMLVNQTVTYVGELDHKSLCIKALSVSLWLRVSFIFVRVIPIPNIQPKKPALNFNEQ